MTTVYAVSSGSYSDYGINHVFRTRELAEAFLARATAVRGWQEYEIEEWELLDELPRAEARYRAYATLMPDGTLGDISIHGDLMSEDRAETTKESESQLDAGTGPWAPRDGTRLGVAGRRTHDEAQKALYDLAARVKAERAGIT
jgi:hypothetical protein